MDLSDRGTSEVEDRTMNVRTIRESTAMRKIARRCFCISMILASATSGPAKSGAAAPAQAQKPAGVQSPIPPVGDYGDFALSRDASSFNPKAPANRDHNPARVLETGD